MRIPALFAGLALALTNALPAAADIQHYSTSLFGSNENPVNASPGVGAALVTLDTDLFAMRVEAAFVGLLSTVTAAHIHCCTDAPMNTIVATTTPTFTDFPSGVMSGIYDHTFDMTLASSYNAAFITNNGGTVSNAFTAFVTGLDAGRAYFNIHTAAPGGFPGGEIRGFLQPVTLVPEPGTYAMMLAGLAVLGWLGARRRKL